MNGIFYFPASDEFGEELWRSDGTAAGTWRVKDIQPGPLGSDIEQLTVEQLLSEGVDVGLGACFVGSQQRA